MSSRVRLLLSVLKNIVLLLLSVAIISGSAYVSIYYMQNRPKPKRKAPPQMAPLVQVQAINAESQQITVSATGTVIPAVEVTLKSQVSGEVIAIHKNFREGGIVFACEELVRLEPRDYELAIAAQEAQLETARYELKSEQGKQDVAKREWDLLDMKENAEDLDLELALRQPQLRQRQAGLRTATAALDKARLNLERTVIKAPCNGIILKANVDVGDQATPQSTLATVIGADAYWIMVSIRTDSLKWIVLPGSVDGHVSVANVTGRGVLREGRIISLLGNLESNGLMAQLLVEIKDPLDLNSTGERHPLLLGEFVNVDLLGCFVHDIFSVPRDALRDGQKIWLATPDDTINIQDADIVWSDTKNVLLRGLNDEDRVIVSDLAGPIDGMSIQLEGAKPAGKAGGKGNPSKGRGKKGARNE